MNNAFENIEHGKFFPARIFVTQVDRCEFHWHIDYEIIMVLKGSVTIYCGATPAHLAAGGIYLFNSRVLHGVQHTEEDNLCLCLQFAPNMIASDMEDKSFNHYFYMNSTTKSLAPKLPYSCFAQKLAKIALRNLDTKETGSMRTHSLLLDFIADLLDYVQYDIRRTPLIQNMSSGDDTYDRILRYIGENLRSESLSNELCHSIGMSEKSLYRYLKNTLGLTLKELLDIIRINRAKEMLRETTKPLAIIWDACGFSSEVSFYRNFKKQVGVTPNEYRNGKIEVENPKARDSYMCFNLGEASELLHGIIEKQEGEEI